MKKIVFIHLKDNHQLKYSQLLAEGMKKHENYDISIGRTIDSNGIGEGDLFVIWAWKPFRFGTIWHFLKKIKANVLVMERAYIGDRHQWVSLGYNGLNGRANFYNQNITSSDRWDKYFKDYLKPWKTNFNKNVLVVGQMPGDASIHKVDIVGWYKRTIKKLNELGYNVFFRNHPLNRVPFEIKRDIKYIRTSQNISFEECIDKYDISAIVTYNSNSGVLGILNGIPTTSIDEGSMVYNITNHDLENDLFQTPDRKDWCRKISYCQWLPEELETGKAWSHIKQGIT